MSHNNKFELSNMIIYSLVELLLLQRIMKDIFIVFLLSIVLHFIATYLIYTLHCSLFCSFPKWNYFLSTTTDNISGYFYFEAKKRRRSYIRENISFTSTCTAIHFHRWSSALLCENIFRYIRHTHTKMKLILLLYTGCFSINICCQLNVRNFR